MSSAVRSYCPNCLHAFEGIPERCQNLACRRIRPRSGWLRLLVEGDILDRNFVIQGLIAVGGAGVTYRAQELDTHGEPLLPVLAIKVLHSRRARGAFLQRLANEARILQHLRHDHIVECLGFSQRKGAAPYLVTRFERGGTLEEWAQQHGPLPGWTVAGVLRQILEGLTAAHQRGVVHRDLKPANLLLAQATPPSQIPHVRIADFGIAKITGKLNEGLTRAGAFIGTPRYAAPEQFAGAPATAATDVFACGVLAYELLTASPLMEEPEGGDLEDWQAAMLAALPPALPAELCQDPRTRQLQELLVGLLQADPAARWGTDHVIAYLDYVLGIRSRPPTLPTQTRGTDRPAPRHDPPPRPQPRPSGAAAQTRSAGPPEPPEAGQAVRDFNARSTPSVPQPAEAVTEPGTRPLPRRAPRSVPPSASPAHPATEVPAPGPPASHSRRATRARPPRSTPVARPSARTALPAKPVALQALVPQRAPAAVLGSHPDDPWVTEARKDQGGGSDLDRLAAVSTAPGDPPAHRDGRSASPAWRRPALAGIVVHPSGQPVWSPAAAVALPAHLPGPPAELLCLLAAVDTEERVAVVRALAGTPSVELDRCIRNHRPGQDPRVGRGVGLAIALLRRREWEAAARTLLADPELGVRVAAATALGSVGEEGRSLDALQALLADPREEVRVAAVRGMAAVAVQTGRQRVAAYALRSLSRDPDLGVRDAVEGALADLE